MGKKDKLSVEPVAAFRKQQKQLEKKKAKTGRQKDKQGKLVDMDVKALEEKVSEK
jgi:hypothetical protein